MVRYIVPDRDLCRIKTETDPLYHMCATVRKFPSTLGRRLAHRLGQGQVRVSTPAWGSYGLDSVRNHSRVGIIESSTGSYRDRPTRIFQHVDMIVTVDWAATSALGKQAELRLARVCTLMFTGILYLCQACRPVSSKGDTVCCIIKGRSPFPFLFSSGLSLGTSVVPGLRDIEVCGGDTQVVSRLKYRH